VRGLRTEYGTAVATSLPHHRFKRPPSAQPVTGMRSAGQQTWQSFGIGSQIAAEIRTHQMVSHSTGRGRRRQTASSASLPPRVPVRARIPVPARPKPVDARIGSARWILCLSNRRNNATRVRHALTQYTLPDNPLISGQHAGAWQAMRRRRRRLTPPRAAASGRREPSVLLLALGANFNLGQKQRQHSWPRTAVNDYTRAIDFSVPAYARHGPHMPSRAGWRASAATPQNITPTPGRLDTAA
jgi:hypothetical protein